MDHTTPILYLCPYDIFVCVTVSLRTSAHRSEVSGPLELELQVFVSRLMWVLRVEIWSCARAANTPNY